MERMWPHYLSGKKDITSKKRGVGPGSPSLDKTGGEDYRPPWERGKGRKGGGDELSTS